MRSAINDINIFFNIEDVIKLVKSENKGRFEINKNIVRMGLDFAPTVFIKEFTV